MTNETNYRTKANAVFFAAIMVVSMVAVGFAAAPAAAGITGDDAGEMSMIWIRQMANSHRALRSRLKMAQTIMDPHPERQKSDIDVTFPPIPRFSTTETSSATIDSLSGSNAGNVTRVWIYCYCPLVVTWRR